MRQRDLLCQHPSHSSLELTRPCRDSHYVTHTVPRAAALGAHPKGPGQQAEPREVPHGWHWHPRARLVDGLGIRHIPRTALVPRSHTHAGAAPH